MSNLAMAIVRHQPDSPTLRSVAEPDPAEGSVLVRTVLVGICGTDRHMTAPGRHPGEAIVLGHEAVGRVVSAPPGSGWAPGDWVTGIVRRPCGQCPACARGEWDFCSSGRYVEHGIHGLDGFGRQRWRSDPAYLVGVPAALGELGVLVEPMSIVAKALEAGRHIAGRGPLPPRRLLVIGAGPVGLLAAAAGTLAGLRVTVVDRVGDGPKPRLAGALGTVYATELAAVAGEPFDLVLECSGAAEVLPLAVGMLASAGVLVQIASIALPAGLRVSANAAIVGTVNAGRRHYAQAVEDLQALDRTWLARLITRRVPLAQWPEALRADPAEVKTVVEFP